ncbi:hypothetical protein [Parachryseolinea silvisoli]|uniref:hypothetical protein n=1 Tax=Parachryseolinea silvisoli TaxID=2873601 RepID=UPI0022659C22|nr:hypothetical protein [Parachryseolinea silvisoli]MCD9019538.1 hypothetical protein [Parachryseolinea silvisoli]
MRRRRIVKKVILVFCCTVGVVLLSGFVFFYNMFHVMPYDKAWFLSDKIETIDAHHINWACDCADFTFRRTPPVDIGAIPDADIFFIEASDPALEVSRAFYDSGYFYQYLRLTGRFYIDRGISRSYELKTPEKPEHDRVFRYDKIEYVDK